MFPIQAPNRNVAIMEFTAGILDDFLFVYIPDIGCCKSGFCARGGVFGGLTLRCGSVGLVLLTWFRGVRVYFGLRSVGSECVLCVVFLWSWVFFILCILFFFFYFVGLVFFFCLVEGKAIGVWVFGKC